jgi:hypothetical protein
VVLWKGAKVAGMRRGQIDRRARERGGLAQAFAGLTQRLLQSGDMLERNRAFLPASLTLGDCGFPASFAWLALLASVLGLDAAWPQSVRAYRGRVEGFAAVAAELNAYAPHMREWLDRKLAAA